MPDCLPLTSFGSLLAKAPAGTPTPRGPGYAVAGSGPDCGRRAFREARGLGGGRGRPRNIVHGRGFFLVRTRRTPLGVGAEASRLVGGSRTVHDLLERDIADFLGAEDAVTLVSGWMTNASLLGYLLTRSDLIVVDELAHNSIVVGADVSHAKVISFDHGNLDDLDAVLTEHRPRAKRTLIVVEGLYSMDGDMPDLRRVVELKRKHDVWLMVDEA